MSVTALCLNACGPSFGQQDVSEIARSHVEANVPAAGDFDRFLRRDLTAYFRHLTTVPVKVEYKLLRKGPTQSGVAYPKFYAWVTVLSNEKPIEEGAIRVAAIEKVWFEVTDFLSKADITDNPTSLERVFPAALVPSILERVGKQ
jgi:hypothetical protein